MLTMKDIPWPPIGETKLYSLPEDILLSDKAFSDKEDIIVPKGQIISISTAQNYGFVNIPRFGIFRY